MSAGAGHSLMAHSWLPERNQFAPGGTQAGTGKIRLVRAVQHLVGEESYPQISEIVELGFWVRQKMGEGIARGYGYGLNEVCPE